jgi:hypothetical protein
MSIWFLVTADNIGIAACKNASKSFASIIELRSPDLAGSTYWLTHRTWTKGTTWIGLFRMAKGAYQVSTRAVASSIEQIVCQHP